MKKSKHNNLGEPQSDLISECVKPIFSYVAFEIVIGVIAAIILAILSFLFSGIEFTSKNFGLTQVLTIFGLLVLIMNFIGWYFYFRNKKQE